MNVNKRDIIVVKATDPSYVLIMKKSSAIVSELGGLTSHAAIVARELGLPCVVAASDATKILKDGQKVVVDGSAGVVYEADW